MIYRLYYPYNRVPRKKSLYLKLVAENRPTWLIVLINTIQKRIGYFGQQIYGSLFGNSKIIIAEKTDIFLWKYGCKEYQLI